MPLARKVSLYRTTLSDTFPIRSDRRKRVLRLDSFVFVQLLLGQSREETGLLGAFANMVGAITLIVAPLLTLLQLQLTFLPYHLEWVVLLQRGAIIADVLVIWIFWSATTTTGALSLLARSRRISVGLLGTAAVVVLSVAMATYPGEKLYRNNLQILLDKINLAPWSQKSLALTKLLFEGDPNQITGRPNSWFSNVLILTDQVLVDSEKTSKFPDQVSISLRGRDLQSAILERSDLRNADFTGANLSYAKLDNAVLKGARFDCAANGRPGSGLQFQEDSNRLIRRYASLPVHQPVWPEDGCSWLQSASLHQAQMQGASLRSARLYGAVLDYAELQGANMLQAQMQGASLTSAHLEGAILDGANFVAARLIGTSLIGATLDSVGPAATPMIGALIRQADLQGASLNSVAIDGARFDDVRLYRAHGKLKAKGVEFSDVNFKDTGYGKNFQRWLDSTLSGIANERQKQVRKNFDVLDPQSAAPKNMINEKSLIGAAFGREGAVDPRHQEELAETLKIAICFVDQPHFVVRGLIESQRLEATGKFLSRLIDELKMASVEEGPSKCPGAKDVTEEDFVDLREIETNIKAGEQIF